MNRVVAFVDGFNLYHALDSKREYHKYKWLDLTKLVQLFIPRKNSLQDIYYFTALASWNPDKVARHKVLIKVFELKSVKVVYGQFRLKDRFCPNCRKEYKAYEEKQTDVNIAIHLFRLAIQDRYDVALIISGDSDLIPSISAVKTTFPAKRIGIVIPIGRRAEELKRTCDFYMKMKEKHLQSSLLDDQIDLGNNQVLLRPASWT